jgi:glycosyltransferase involved in cell wall biosynthesis
LNPINTTNTATVRVYLPTYKRHHLLPLALESLRAQTMSSWVCELHNDDPDDPFPAELLQKLGDSRIKLRQHSQNLGALQSFNLIFAGAKEPFCSLLEDDNSWEPAFLEEMLGALNSEPAAALAWCNQRIRNENADGSLSSTEAYANPLEPGGPRLIPWGQPHQAMGAFHANGAMLIRSSNNLYLQTPRIPFAGVEAFRERMIPHPMLYVPKPLAWFTQSRQTARRGDLPEWNAFQTMLLSTFVRHAKLDRKGLLEIWEHYAAQNPPPSSAFIFSAFLNPECRPFLKMATGADWFRFLKGTFGHPGHAWKALHARRRHKDWWQELDRHTAARFRSCSPL